MAVTTQQLSWGQNSNSWPFIGKRTFELTIDDPEATKRETFWGIQAVYTGDTPPTSPPKVLVLSGDTSGYVNPVYIGLNGGVYAVAGIGIVSEGTDCHGKTHTASENVEVFGWGGNSTITFGAIQ